jgi:hypothetical protein
MMRRLQYTVALLLVVCIVGISGIAPGQTVLHDSHHAHHQAATHGTVLCSWMCAAGQVLDSIAAPTLVEQLPVARAEQPAFQQVLSTALKSPTSRGPPSFSII